MQSRLGRRLSIALGWLLLAFGVAEVIAHRTDTVPALLFWGLTLLGGGALVLAGVLVWPRRQPTGVALLVIGALTGMLPTVWTILMPLLGLGVIALAVRDASRSPEMQQGPRRSEGPAG